jgi:hypothetical protein
MCSASRRIRTRLVALPDSEVQVEDRGLPKKLRYPLRLLAGNCQFK